jgi:hypothetical protein
MGPKVSIGNKGNSRPNAYLWKKTAMIIGLNRNTKLVDRRSVMESRVMGSIEIESSLRQRRERQGLLVIEHRAEIAQVEPAAAG